MELYAEYIKEREGSELISTPYGWLSYRITDKECFIIELFVTQAARRSGQGSELLTKIIKQALRNNCELITANIHLFDPNHDGTLRGALARGFKILSANNDVLLVAKKITEDLSG